MNTKRLLLASLATALALQLCPAAMAQTIDAGLGSPVPIPDYNVTLGINGIASQIDVSGVGGMIGSVTVTLDITGDPTAYNGDYYAYLQFGSGLEVLLNNIDNGTGNNPGDGMDVALSDSGATSIQSATENPPTSMLTGTYTPASGGASTGAGLDGTFGGMNDANGEWTLFVADESAGGVGQLVDWSITLTAPDNGSTLLLLGMGVGLLGLCSLRQPRTAAIPVSRD